MILGLLGINVREHDQIIHIIIGALTLLFLGLIGAAFYFYKGTFDFLTSFLSDLGQTMAGGVVNDPSSIIFSVAMIIAGFSFFIFFLVSPEPLGEIDSKFKILITIGELVGLVSSVFMALIGFFPVDTQKETHELIGWIFFVLISVTIILYSLFFFFSYLESDSSPENTLLFYIVKTVGFIIAIVLLILFSNILDTTLLPDAGIIIILTFILLLILVIIVLFFDFDGVINFVNYVTSIFIVGLIAIIIYYVFTNGLQGFIELIFISAIIIWSFGTNARAFILSLETN